MQTLAILFLGVFTLVLGVYVLSLSRQNQNLTEDNTFRKIDNRRYYARVLDLERDLGEEEAERRRFAQVNFNLHQELNSTKRMLMMMVGRDLENNITFDNIVVEIGRNGVYYKFSDKESADDGYRRSDEESEMASRYSP